MATENKHLKTMTEKQSEKTGVCEQEGGLDNVRSTL